MKKGFTLIELLVVVLIIGILSAVALPQYTKAVNKSRYATLKLITQSLYEAQLLYYLENGTYASKFEDLAVDVGTPIPGSDHIRGIKNGSCQLAGGYVYCILTTIKMSYKINYTGRRVCVVYNDTPNKKIADEICKAETGSTPDSYGQYFYN